MAENVTYKYNLLTENGDKVTATFKSIGDSADQSGKKVEVLNQRIAALSKTQSIGNKQISVLSSANVPLLKEAGISSGFNNIKVDTGDSVTQINNVEKALSGWGTGNKTVDDLTKRFNSLRWSIVNVGFAIGAISAVLSPLVLLTKYGIELETVFTRIAIVTGDSAKNISSSLMSIRKGTMFGLEESSKAFLDFTKAGFSAGEAALALKPIMTLATVGFTDMSTAAKIVSQIIHEFNLAASDSAEIVGILASAANKSAADVETFATALAYVGPMAEQLGISLSETAASISLLSNAGLSSSKAGTSMTAMLSSLVNTSNAGEKQMKKLGVTLFDAKGEFLGIDQMVRQFNAALSDLTPEEQLKTLSEIFETRGARAVMTYMNSYKENGDTIKKFEKDITDARYAVEALADVQETAAAKAKTAWEDLKASLAPAAGWLAEAVTGFVNIVNTGMTIDTAQTRIKELKDLGIDTTQLEKEASMFSEATGRTMMENLAGGVSGKDILLAKNLEDSFKRLTYASRIKIQVDAALKEGAIELNEVVPKTNTTFETFIKTIASGNIYTEDFQKNLDVLAEYMGKIQSPAERASAALSELSDLTKAGGKIAGTEVALTKEEAGLYLNILNTSQDINTYDLERVRILESLTTAMRDQDTLILSQETHLKGALNSLSDLVSSFVTSGLNTFEKEFNDAITGLTDIATRFREQADASGYANSVMKVVDAVKEAKSEYADMDSELIKLNEQLEKKQSNLDKLKISLEEQNSILGRYKDALSKVEETISNLSNPRFTMQTEVEQLISKVDVWQKKQKLASYGIGDAFTFLQSAVKMTESEYENFFKTIVKTNDATKDSKNDYDAWRETVKTFIEESIKVGNDLSKSVTGAVGKYKTLLLSTSKFSDSTDSSSEAIALLQDAYDVHYGAMTDDVKYAIQAHEEQANGIYSSSGQIISALQSQWIEQNKWTTAIEGTEAVISTLKEKIDITQLSIASIKNSIEETTNAMKDLISKTKAAIAELANLDKSSGTSESSTSKGTDYTESGSSALSRANKESGGLYSGYTDTVQYDNYGNPYNVRSFNDFVMRPGQEPVSFDANDTIIGTKGGLGGGVNIESISISGVSGNAEDFAYAFAQQLRRELRAL